MTRWRELRDWQRRGVWRRPHRAMLDRLAAADQIEVTAANVRDSRMLDPLLDCWNRLERL